jgi:hypothetical protein
MGKPGAYHCGAHDGIARTAQVRLNTAQSLLFSRRLLLGIS